MFAVIAPVDTGAGNPDRTASDVRSADYDLEETIRQPPFDQRCSCPIGPWPGKLIDEALDLAIAHVESPQRQPWPVVFASGAARDDCRCSLLEAAQAGAPKVPALPEHYRPHSAAETGKVVYGSDGVSARDTCE